MPLVDISIIAGVFTSDQKQQMISKVTAPMVEIEGETLRDGTWVRFIEGKLGDWGIGGRCLTAQDVQNLAAGKG